MKRFLVSMVAGLLTVAFSVPVFATEMGSTGTHTQDPAALCAEHPTDPSCQSGSTVTPPPAGTPTPPPADTATPPPSGSSTPPPADTSTPPPASAEFTLSAYFSAEQLSLLSVEEQATLKAKLSVLSGAELEKKVKKIHEWLSERLEEQKDKMENQAQWEAKQKAKFEAKFDKQFAKLMADKKAEMERQMQIRQKRMEEKKARMEANRARRFAKPKVFHAWIDSVDAVKGLVYLKKHGAQATILVTAKTVLVVTEEDGARTATLADFQTGDRLFGLVRRNPQDPRELIGVVLVKLPEQHGDDDDDDDDDVPPPMPPSDSAPSDSGASTPLPATN